MDSGQPGPPFSAALIIPALDEEQALPLVLQALPRRDLQRIVVVDNGSRDGTADAALAGGAELVREARRGYGRACRAGLLSLAGDPPDVVVFLDADFSDDPADLPHLLGPIRRGEADLVLGSRILGRCQPGSIPPQALWGNRLALLLLRWRHGARFTDLGPFRAIRWAALEGLALEDPGCGWNVEMQLQAARTGLCWMEVPVSYRRRVGRSKISGTLSGTLRAGAKILWMVLRPGRSGRRPAA